MIKEFVCTKSDNCIYYNINEHGCIISGIQPDLTNNRSIRCFYHLLSKFVDVLLKKGSLMVALMVTKQDYEDPLILKTNWTRTNNNDSYILTCETKEFIRNFLTMYNQEAILDLQPKPNN